MRTVGIFTLAIIVALATATPGRASELILTDKQIESIAQSCSNSKVLLNRTHASDAVLRINLGQRYENLSTRFMAPLNSRIALNGLDGVDLAKTTIAYNQELLTFRSDYITYESLIADALDTDCTKDPIGYYSSIERAREARAEVRTSTIRLNKLIEQYRKQFESFAKTVTDEAKS